VHKINSLRFLFATLLAWLPFASGALYGKETGPSNFEDPIAKFEPLQEQSEEQKDRVKASALYSHGRLLFQREDYPRALRHYQRAWRYDPESIKAVDEILKLSGYLKRNDEFVRYALIRADADAQDPLMLRQLAGYLTSQQEFERAAELYEKSLELQKDTKDGSKILVHAQLGQLYFLAGNNEKAAEKLAVVVSALDDPDKFGLTKEMKKAVLDDAERTFRLFTESLFEIGRLDEAEEAVRKANNIKPNDALLAYHMARLAAKRDKTDEALQQLEKYLVSGSADARTLPYELFAELLKKKHADESEAKERLKTRLTEIYERKPNASLGYYLGKVAFESDDVQLALEIFEPLVVSDPLIDGFEALIEIRMKEKDVDKLADVLGQAVLKTGTLEPLAKVIDPIAENADMTSMLIDLAQTRKRANDKEIGKGVALAIGFLAIDAKRYDDAEKLFELALEESEPPKRTIMLTWGIDLLMSEKYEQAASVFQRAINKKIVKNDADFYFYLAGALQMEERTDEAIAAAKKAAEFSPKSPRMASRLPWILYRAKRYEEAEQAYLDLLKKYDASFSSSDIRDTLRETRLVLSNICVIQQRMPEAVEWIEQVLDEFPEDIGALNDLGYLWADEGEHLKRALAMTRKAVAAEPDNIAYRDSLGWAYYRLGRYEEALAELMKATKDDDPDGVILDHLGDVYLKKNDQQQAVTNWKKAVEAFKKQDDLKLLEKTELKIKKHTAE